MTHSGINHVIIYFMSSSTCALFLNRLWSAGLVWCCFWGFLLILNLAIYILQYTSRCYTSHQGRFLIASHYEAGINVEFGKCYQKISSPKCSLTPSQVLLLSSDPLLYLGGYFKAVSELTLISIVKKK